MNPGQQLLRDADISPTDKIIANGLGTASDVYTKFIGGLERYDISLMDWRYYNDGKAWLSKGEYKWTTSRGTNKIKPVFWLSIWEGFFKVVFYFSEKVRENLLALPLSKNTMEIVENAEPMGKKLRFLPVIFEVTDEKQLDDLFILAQFRKENI